MVQTARDRGVPVRALADEMSGYFQDMAAKLNISHDRFISTVEPDHHAATQALWERMAAAGDLYLDRYEGGYSVRDEACYDEQEQDARSEEHTSELQLLMRTSHADLCCNKT